MTRRCVPGTRPTVGPRVGGRILNQARVRVRSVITSDPTLCAANNGMLYCLFHPLKKYIKAVLFKP